jgi:hypothetical protein
MRVAVIGFGIVLRCFIATRLLVNGFQGELRQLLMLSVSRQELHEVFRRDNDEDGWDYPTAP